MEYQSRPNIRPWPACYSRNAPSLVSSKSRDIAMQSYTKRSSRGSRRCCSPMTRAVADHSSQKHEGSHEHLSWAANTSNLHPQERHQRSHWRLCRPHCQDPWLRKTIDAAAQSHQCERFLIIVMISLLYSVIALTFKGLYKVGLLQLALTRYVFRTIQAIVTRLPVAYL